MSWSMRGDRVVLLPDSGCAVAPRGSRWRWGIAQIATFTEGQIGEWKVYVDQSKALEAAGLSE